MSVNGTLVKAKMCTFTLESTHFIFKKCAIYTHDGASAKFSTNSQETDYSVDRIVYRLKFPRLDKIFSVFTWTEVCDEDEVSSCIFPPFCFHWAVLLIFLYEVT